MTVSFIIFEMSKLWVYKLQSKIVRLQKCSGTVLQLNTTC